MDVKALARYYRSMRTPYRCALAEELASCADRLDTRSLVVAASVGPLASIKHQRRLLAIASRSLRSAAKAIEITDSAPYRSEAKRRKANKQSNPTL